MKSEDKYRFTLQWASDSDERIRAGELLERLGNSKSKFIVAAANEYVQNHPEFAEPAATLKLIVHDNMNQMSREDIEQLIRRIIDEKSTGAYHNNARLIDSSMPLEDASDLLTMLDSLELF